MSHEKKIDGWKGEGVRKKEAKKEKQARLDFYMHVSVSCHIEDGPLFVSMFVCLKMMSGCGPKLWRLEGRV